MKSINRVLVIALLVITCQTAFCKGPYKDGTYYGKSRSIYVNEPYYGYVLVVIEKGKIIKTDFLIRDSTNGEIFDEKYEKHYAGNDEYIKQCRNDWNGVQTYPGRYLKAQDISKVDAVSGATWSYNIFKASVEDALSKAEAK